jgi:hypothetical protein
MTNVERGAKFLDRTFGLGWPRRIKLRRLDLASSEHCVLAQVHPSHNYVDAGISLGLNLEQIQAWGFTSPRLFFSPPDAIEDLTQAWKELIRKRLHRKK